MLGIGAIVLAAGASQRFGADSKLLASIGGEPLVRRVVQALVRGGVSDIVVVTGHERALIEAALEALPVRFAHNETWVHGMASSIVTGVAALPAGVDGAFIVPADMPFLSAATIERLAELFDKHGRAAIVYPETSGGEQRNPVLWPRRFFGDLVALSGAQGAKQLLAAFGAESIAVAIDDHVLADIDTDADLAVARARLRDSEMTVTIYHNPKCGTSRNTLAMIRASGADPEVIEYLVNPPTRERLTELIVATGLTPRALLRRKGTPYDELGLDDPKWTDAQLIDLMAAHPILIERPIVVTPLGVRLCRPAEVVLEILPTADIGAFTKEDGEVVPARKSR